MEHSASDCLESQDQHQRCCSNNTAPSVVQTLDEMEFERGLWYAAQTEDLDRVRQLLQKGTNVNKRDNAGFTPLHYAVRTGNISLCHELIQAGADINPQTKSLQATPLHRAAAAGKIEVVKLLLHHGADITLTDADGKNVLHRAAESKNSDLCNFIAEKNTSLKFHRDNRGNYPYDYVKENKLLYEILYFSNL